MTAFRRVTANQETIRPYLRLHTLFLMMAPLIYVAYALLTPPFQTPDEQQHLFRAWQLSELHLIGERRGNASGGVLPESVGRAAVPEIGSLEPHVDRKIVKRSFSEALSRGTPVKTSAPARFYDFRGAAIYSPAGYLPQITAIWVGGVIDLSVENIVRLGRLLNAAASILLIYLALRFTPAGASAILFVGLLPMTAAASAAFGQDGVVIGGSCLLTAIGLRMAAGSRQRLSDLLICGALAILLTLSKFFYLPLAMIGGQPFVRGRTKLQRLWPTVAICAIAVVMTAVWLHANAGSIVSPGNVQPANHTNWPRRLMEFPGAVERTYVGHGALLLDSLFEFGWLNVPSGTTAVFLSVTACGLVCIAGDAGASSLSWQTRLWLVALAGGAAFLISLATWLYWTPTRMNWIEGLQGRYFIPLAPALLVAVQPKRLADTNVGRFVPHLMIGANVFVLAAIARTFYIF